MKPILGTGDKFVDWRTKTNQISENVGDPDSLVTDDKSSLVAGVNSAVASLSASVNSAVALLDGNLSKTTTGGTTTLTASEFSNGVITVDGTLVSDVTVIVPDVIHKFILTNETSGEFELSVKTSAQLEGVEIEQGSSASLYCDGSTVVLVGGAGGSGNIIESELPPEDPEAGDKWIKTSTKIEYTWLTNEDLSGQWVETGAVMNTYSTLRFYEQIATEGQTSFNVAYTPGFITVYMNGYRLSPSDYVATSGTTVVLNVGASAGDELLFETMGTFAIANTVDLDGDQTVFGEKTFANNMNVPSLNGGQLAGYRNKIINGKMEIAQEGTSFSGITGTVSKYVVDMWAVHANIEASLTAAYTLADSPPTSSGCYSNLKLTVNTADTSIATTHFAFVKQHIEGVNARSLIGQTFTLSFWVKSSKTGIHCAAFRNSGVDRSYVAEYAIDAANTWEYKTITVQGGLITDGTWNWNTGTGIVLSFALASGPTFHTTAGAWQTGNYIATANQVNCLDTVGNVFAITGVQLELGEVATPFEHRYYSTELFLCQRYFEIVDIGRAIGVTYTANGDTRASFSFRTTKRVVPTLTKTGVLNVIAFGPTAEVLNVNIGDTIGLTANSANGFSFTNVSNYAALAPCGGMAVWGALGSVIVTANARL